MRVMPPANTADVMAMWKQRLSSMCQHLRVMWMVLEEKQRGGAELRPPLERAVCPCSHSPAGRGPKTLTRG